MKHVEGNRRRARWGKKTSSGTRPGTATIRHPVARSRISLRRRKSGMPSAATPSPPSPSRYSRQARPTSRRCCRSNSNRQIACSSPLYPSQFCSMVKSDRTAVIDLSATASFFKGERRGGASLTLPLRLEGLLQALLRYPAQPVDKLGQVFNQPREIRFPLVVALIHVERAVDFDLQRVTVHSR